MQNTSVMLGVIGEWEDVIFKKRQLREEEMKRRREQNKRHEQLAKGVNAKDAETGGSLTQTRRKQDWTYKVQMQLSNLRLHWVVKVEK